MSISLRTGCRALVAVAATLAVGCRPGLGQHCVCQGECRGALLCAQQGRILQEGTCAKANEAPGECVSGDDVDENATSLGPPPIYHDIGGKRDLAFGPEDGSTSTSTSTGGTSTSGGSGVTSTATAAETSSVATTGTTDGSATTGTHTSGEATTTTTGATGTSTSDASTTSTGTAASTSTAM